MLPAYNGDGDRDRMGSSLIISEADFIQKTKKTQ